MIVPSRKDHPESNVVLHAYMIKLITLLGFMPPWENCARTGDKLNLDDAIFFNATEACVLSRPYASASDLNIPIPMVKWVNFMQKYPIAATAKVQTTPGERAQVWHMLQAILPNILTSPLKSEKFLEISNR